MNKEGHLETEPKHGIMFMAWFVVFLKVKMHFGSFWL